MDKKAMEMAFNAAFAIAIRKVGMEAFKRTSFFASNEKIMEFKKAA